MRIKEAHRYAEKVAEEIGLTPLHYRRRPEAKYNFLVGYGTESAALKRIDPEKCYHGVLVEQPLTMKGIREAIHALKRWQEEQRTQTSY